MEINAIHPNKCCLFLVNQYQEAVKYGYDITTLIEWQLQANHSFAMPSLVQAHVNKRLRVQCCCVLHLQGIFSDVLHYGVPWLALTLDL